MSNYEPLHLFFPASRHGTARDAALVSELAGLPLWEINCGLQTSVYDMFGRFVGLGKENWVDGQIVSWCRYGGMLYLDEANMMKQDVATRLNPLLDTRGHMVLTERDNEVIPRYPHGYVVISMNPYSAEFAGTKPLNAAFRRMSVWIDFDYLSVGGTVAPDEVQMVSRRSRTPLEVAEKIVRVGAEIRRRYKAGDLPYGPSVGDLVNWATLVADGLDPATAAEETIVSLTSDDPEVQASVRRVVRMVLVDGKGVLTQIPSFPHTESHSSGEQFESRLVEGREGGAARLEGAYEALGVGLEKDPVAPHVAEGRDALQAVVDHEGREPPRRRSATATQSVPPDL